MYIFNDSQHNNEIYEILILMNLTAMKWNLYMKIMKIYCIETGVPMIYEVEKLNEANYPMK